MEQKSDGELIEFWQNDRNQSALNELFQRHYAYVYRRVKRSLGSAIRAEDVTQSVFEKLLNHLDNYSDEGKFIHFVNTVTRTTIIDEHRRKPPPEGFDEEFDYSEDEKPKPEDMAETERQFTHLTTHCIPLLPPKERLVYLIMNESEFWDYDTPLDWSELAMLNGINKETAWSRFELAREALMKGKSVAELDDEQVLIFLVWTECTRANKNTRPLKYFARLLGENPQNLRNRSHQAKKKLKACMEAFVRTGMQESISK